MTQAPFVITTSWDDGHPADARVADLLHKYGISGTFYVPSRNSEERLVMSAEAVRALSGRFEIGGHTRDHVVLTGLPEPAVAEQVGANKNWLESVLGRAVTGFCFPRGRYNAAVKRAVRAAGFAYARTVKNLCADAGDDDFEVPTTLQFYPHGSAVYVRNFLAYAPSLGRARRLVTAISTANLLERVRLLSTMARRECGIFHLWGHSWELDEHGLWGELEDALRYLAAEFPGARFETNAGIVALRSGEIPRSRQ